MNGRWTRMVRWISSIQQGLQQAWWACWQWFERWLWSPFTRGIHSVWLWLWRLWQWPLRAWKWLRRLWWYLSERWPVSQVVVFIKALLLLCLWLLTAWAMFRYLLSPLISGSETEKTTAPLLVALVTALVGFGVQQWKSQENIEQEKREKRNEARSEISRLSDLVNKDFSEASRYYLDLTQRSGAAWRNSRVRDALEETWNSTAPAVMRDAVGLLDFSLDEKRFHRTIERLGIERAEQAIKWTLEGRLDSEWQQWASNKIISLANTPKYGKHFNADILRIAEQHYWRAVLRSYPHISLWRGFPLSIDPQVSAGLHCLKDDYQGNLFGSRQAETDTLLLKRRIDLPCLEDLRGPRPALIVGGPGSGKTATALLMAYDALRVTGQGDVFPIYYPASLYTIRLDRVAQVISKTLLHYLAVSPSGFLRQNAAGKAAMANLLTLYHRDLTLRFHLAGLPSSGAGAEVCHEIEQLIQDGMLQRPLSDERMLSLLSRAFPDGFRYTMLLLDVQEMTGDEDGENIKAHLKATSDLSDALARVGIFVKMFLPRTLREHLPGGNKLFAPPVELQWLRDDMGALLKKYIEPLGNVTLAEWCDSKDLTEQDWQHVDDRLFQAAQYTPRGLIRKGNELLRRIGQTQQRLTADDLNKILGPLPEQPNETGS